MSSTPRDHRASYDEEGNIILPGGQPRRSRLGQGEDGLHRSWSDVREQLSETAAHVVEESRTQYAESARDLQQSLSTVRREARGSGQQLLAILSQPVWLVRPNRKPKQYRRGTLFLLDTVRFGGTFALIFGILFLGLNYQSFWQIARDQLSPLSTAQQTLTRQTNETELRNSLLRTPQLAVAGQRTSGDILSFLPPVGPPENRLVVPKLNLNIPLVTPSSESLLNEDWDQVERDIQHALQEGVVHYPGTARPGQAGNFFVTGHSSYYPWAPGDYKTVFARLHQLEIGDEYEVYYGGDRHRYIIREKTEVKPTNVEVLRQPLDRRMATLMTCTPVGTTLRRLILVAEEVDPLTGEPLAIGELPERAPDTIQPQLLPI